ncbi:MAG: hypothetical protein IJH79_19935 [Lentisphaeria bacterium]|nr:hypothetical protein [Lentisphaeria bacterium]
MPAKTASGTAFAAAYLKAPPNLPKKWQRVAGKSCMEQSYLKLLNRLSCRTDISEMLSEGKSLEDTLELAFLQWFHAIYPKSLLAYFKPDIEIYLYPDDPDRDDRRYLKIAVSNAYIHWNDFDISQELSRAVDLWPGPGVAVLNALTDLPYRHWLWTPENIMNFVREMFWFGWKTEQEFLEAEYPDHLEENGDESVYLFTEKELEYMKLWDKRTPVRKYVHPVGREIIQVCRKIGANEIDSGGFGTTFPEIILWNDDENVIGGILDNFEQDAMAGEEQRLHAGGTQWECEDLRLLDRDLNQIELYVREKEILCDALINFKTRMKPCLTKKNQSM